MEGRVFHVCTDHKPLTYALSTRSDHHSPRQARHLDYISQFTTDLRHVKGAENAAADALSRIEANSLSSSAPVISFEAMAQAQRSDPKLTQFLASSASSSQSQWNTSGNDWWHYPLWHIHMSATAIRTCCFSTQSLWFPSLAITPRDTGDTVLSSSLLGMYGLRLIRVLGSGHRLIYLVKELRCTDIW